MLERELRQREMEELHRIVLLQATVSPSPAPCFCPLSDTGMPGYVPVYQSSPLVFDCDQCHTQEFKTRPVEHCPRDILTTQNFSPSLKSWDTCTGTETCLEPAALPSFQGSRYYCCKNRGNSEVERVPADSSHSTPPQSAAADRLDVTSKRDSTPFLTETKTLSQTEQPEKHCRASGLKSFTHKHWDTKPNSIKNERPLPFSVEALLMR